MKAMDNKPQTPNSQKIPTFEPYEQIKICGNTVGVKYLFKIDDFYPIIMGKSNLAPIISIYTKIDSKIKCILDEGWPESPQIVPTINKDWTRIEMYDYDEEKWMSILKLDSTNKECPNITFIDLRPIGLNCYGDDNNGLNVAGNLIKDIHVLNAEIFVKVGK